MKCKRFLEWMEAHDDEDREGREWDVLDAHSRSCPDCRLELARRHIIRGVMGSLPEVSIPHGLAKSITQHLELAGDDDLPPSFIERWLEWSVTPMATGLSFACLLMVAGLMTAGRSDSRTPALVPGSYAVAPTPIARGYRDSEPIPSRPRNGESLVRLTSQEISEFRQKLADYRRRHPEMESRPLSPGAALVDYQRP